jgi:hypothetical protein
MFLHLGELKITFIKERGFGFTHDEPKHDHIYIVVDGTSDQPDKCLFLFRELFEHHGVDMDEFLEYMKENEFYVRAKKEATPTDLEMYEYWIEDGKTDRPLLITVDKEDEPEGAENGSGKELVRVLTPQAPELTVYGPTMERHLKLEAEFIAYLIETNRGHLL